MAKSNSTCADKRVIDQVRVERYDWGDVCRGTRAALIAAGIVSDGQFPGDPGRGSTSCSYFADGSMFRRGGPGGCKSVLKIERYGKKFQVRVVADAAEQKRRRAPDAREVSRAAVDARRVRTEDLDIQRLRDLPATAQDFRERAGEEFVFHIVSTSMAMSPREGFRYTDAAIAEFNEAATKALDVLFCGDTEGRPPMEGMQRTLCARAKDDEPLQEFLSSLDFGRKASRTSS